MNLVITLLEATPLIDSWGLKKIQHTPYPLYSANHRRLIVSGMGGKNAAKATQYLIDHSLEKPALVKPGNCRSWKFAKGPDLFGWSNYNQGEPEAFYPQKSSLPNSGIRTNKLRGPFPFTKNMGFDMEAHAFTEPPVLHPPGNWFKF